MKRLNKILLINWHMFTCSEIEIKGNVLITGHNGAGKSTLLDAVQYVLTGGKKKFNLAANEDGARTLEGYVRGRLGTESKEYLREHDVTSHIALEFFDEEEQKPFVLGAVIELPEGNKCREHFYMSYRAKAERGFYLSEITNEIFDKAKFEQNLRASRIKYYFAISKDDARNLVTKTFALNSKYPELIRRALAFKPIGDLNEFMYRFLLPEEQINTDALRTNVLEYRKFENTLQEQRERLSILADINDANQKRIEKQTELSINEYLESKITVARHTARREELKTILAKIDRDLKTRKGNELTLSLQLQDILREIANIQSEMNTTESGGRIVGLKERLNMLDNSFAALKQWKDDITVALKKDIAILDSLSLSHKLSVSGLLEDASLDEEIRTSEEKVRRLLDNNLVRAAEIRRDMDQAQAALSEVNARIATLQAKNYPYEESVQSLIKLLKEELSRMVGREIHVKPFCEYLEINDETWRNAIEGYLNTQRFDLFVEPQYFKRASRIYEQFKGSLGIFGVGIVDVGKLDEYDVIKEGTLAEKVTTDNLYARQYANMLLGRVDCEENVENLGNHKQAITPTCMIYRNYTLRAINPRIYRRPFIGRHAIELQLETEQKKQEGVRNNLALLTRREKEAEHQREELHKTDFSYGRNFIKERDDYIRVEKERREVKEQLDQLMKDPTWITLQEQMNELSRRQLETHTALETVLQKIAELNHQLENSEQEYYDLERQLKEEKARQELQEGEMLDLLGSINEAFEALKRNARSDYDRMAYQNANNREKIKEQIRSTEVSIKDHMHIYNQRTGFGFEESIQAIDSYLAQYDRLRTVDIDASINKAIEARKKCERSFQEEFISTLRARIERAKANLKALNRSLEDKNFQGDHYAFVYEASSDPTFAQYYRILSSNEDYLSNSIFMEELTENNRALMDELFARLVAVDNSEKNEQLLRSYTDYRKYMKYDIRITHSNGDTTMFSRVNREKSGGETQTPFYVIIAASFDQLANNRKNQSGGCLVLFDEAFNNMDENRIEALMKFYRSLNIQLLIAVPEGRVRNIMPYTETTLLLVSQNNRILHEAMIHEEA